MKYVVYAVAALAVLVVLANLVGVGQALLWGDGSRVTLLILGLAWLIAGVVVALGALRLAALPDERWRAGAWSALAALRAHVGGLLAATGASLLGLLTLGLPGILWFELMDRTLVPWVARPRGWPTPHGDTVWPTAIGYSFVAPWIAFGVFLALKKLRPSVSSVLWAPAVLAATLAALVALHLVHLRSG